MPSCLADFRLTAVSSTNTQRRAEVRSRATSLRSNCRDGWAQVPMHPHRLNRNMLGKMTVQTDVPQHCACIIERCIGQQDFLPGKRSSKCSNPRSARIMAGKSSK